MTAVPAGPAIQWSTPASCFGCIPVTYGNNVCDKSRKVGGKQCITTLDGYVIPLQICDGLPYFNMTPPTDNDLDIYPHIILTSDSDWDPNILDN